MVLCAAGAPHEGAGPVVKVQEDVGANGWTVRASFRNAPEEFARMAHVWTLAQAKEIAEELKATHAQGGHSEDLSVAEIRIEGKDGDGEVKPDQGPHLADWPQVEQQFRAHTKVRSPDLDKKLAELKGHWQRAAGAAEEALRSREQPITSEKEQALRQLQESYNAKADALDEAFFGHESAPLPRLRLPDAARIHEHAREWAITKRVQSDSEQLTQKVRQQESDLTAFQKSKAGSSQGKASETQTLFFDDSQPKSGSGGRRNETGKKTGGPQSKQDEMDAIRRTVDRQLKSAEELLVDSSRIAPPADGFAGDGVRASYTSTPRIEIRKTDADGKELTTNQQPPGFPKPFLGGSSAAAGEGIFVDPSLRVQLISKSSDKKPEVRAGMYGRVTAVDPSAGRVELQVDRRGTRVLMSGFQPQGVRVGDYVEPVRPIGNFNSAPRSKQMFEFVIRTINANNRLVNPGPVLDYAKRKPKSSGDLARDVSEPEAAELPVKAPAPEEAGKPADTWRIVFDENAEKGANLKQGAFDVREAIAKRDLERAKERESMKVDESGLFLAKQRQVESEVKAAEEKMKALQKQDDALSAEAEKLTARKKELEQENAALAENKRRLDAMAARAKASNSDADIQAFNAEAQRHNERFRKLDESEKARVREYSSLVAKAGALTREMTKEQQKTQQLQQELAQLQAKATAAKGEVEQARGEVKAKEQALATIQQEKQQKMQVSAPAKKGGKGAEGEAGGKAGN